MALAHATLDDLKKIGELTKNVKMCMLTTQEGDGTLRSRPMATLAQDKGFNGIVWFFTELHSGKVDELHHDRHVNLAYADATKQAYVSISGKARVIKDPAKARELWTPFMKAWFPQGVDDPSLAILRVEADEAEYWEAPHAAVVRIVGLLKAALAGERYDAGVNRRVEV